MHFVLIALLCSRRWVAFITFFPVKSCVHLSQKKLSNTAVRKEKSMNWEKMNGEKKLRKEIQEKVFTVIENCECEWWRLDKITTNVKLLDIRESFLYRRSLTEHQLLERIKKGNLFGYVQCDIEVHKNLRANFANFPPTFKNTIVSKIDNGDLMVTYAEEGITYQPQNIKFHVTRRNSDNSSALVLSSNGKRCYKIAPVCWVHSKEMFQQLCTGSSGRKNERWPKTKLQCSRRDDDAPGQ